LAWFFFWASGLQQMMMKECWMVPELEKQLVEVAEMECLELEVGATLVVAWELSEPSWAQLGDRF